MQANKPLEPTSFAGGSAAIPLDGPALMETAGAEGQKVKGFRKLCASAFEALLGGYGFTPASGESRAGRDYASEVYRNGPRYVRVSVNTHYRDAPSNCEVELGEGESTMPESDWNSVALWQHAIGHGHSPPAGDPYPLRDVSELQEVLARMSKDLELKGADFLANDLKTFRRVRSDLAKSRRPYMIHTPDAQGKYHAKEDPESAALKDKYSREGDRDS